MRDSSTRLLPVLACALMCAFISESKAASSELVCTLQYQVKGWSAVVAVANGSGTVTCSDGTSKAVAIKMRSVGATVGKSEINHGAGKFTHVGSIADVLGTYAQADVHAGLVKSSSAQVLTKGTVSLALAGAGDGVDLGIAVGEVTLSADK